LLAIQGGSDLGLHEVSEAARLVQEAAHPDANIIFGSVIDDALGDEVRVTVIAAGFEAGGPTPRSDVAQAQARPPARSETQAPRPRPAPVHHESRPAPQGGGYGATAPTGPGAWGAPQQAFSPSRPGPAEPETEKLEPAQDEHHAGQQHQGGGQQQAEQPQ